jgi:glycerate kinase
VLGIDFAGYPLDLGCLKVLVASDKFKGTLSAAEATLAIARGWRSVRPSDKLELLPITDGGDGFGEAMAALLGAKPRTYRTINAAGKPCQAKWWWEPNSKTAIIESAQVIGLAMLPVGRFHPFALDTFGLGRLLQHVTERGGRRCLIGIGGSATNDGGFGLARALGWEFLNKSGHPIERWTDLVKLACISAPRRRAWPRSLVVAVDVQNPLLGRRGATRIYGPQKGLRVRELPQAERCLSRLAKVVEQQFSGHLQWRPGAGAAGGLGFGLMAFCGGRLAGGFDLFARKARLPHRLKKADLVLTGEGRIDVSTFMGKGVGQLARLCRERNIPCIGFAGALGQSPAPKRKFREVYALTDMAKLSEAIARPATWLMESAAKAAQNCPAL